MVGRETRPHRIQLFYNYATFDMISRVGPRLDVI
jgi:hypothetical protein